MSYANNESEKSNSAGIEILPPYSRQNDNAGKKKAASKRGPVILSEVKNLKNRFCQFLPWPLKSLRDGQLLPCTPQSLRDSQLLPCFRGGAAGGGVFNRGAIQVP